MRTVLARARVGLRLARREARRRPWRTLLVVLLVLVPTAGMTIGVTLFRTSEWTAADRRLAEFGSADAFAWPNEHGIHNDLASLAAALPATTRVVADRRYEDRIRMPEHSSHVQMSDLPLDDPMMRGRFDLLDGRLVEAGDEIVVTDWLAHALDLDVGDTVRPQQRGDLLRVVGEVRGRSGRYLDDQRSAYVLSLGEPATVRRTYLDLPGDRSLCPDPDDVGSAPCNRSVPGWNIQALEVGGSLTKTDGVSYTYLGGAIALMALGTVIAAAFTIGARRQLHTVGLLSSTGAAPSSVRWFLVAQGFLAGLLGSIAGVLLVVAGSRFVPDLVLSKVVNRPVGGPVFRLADLAPIVVIGTLAAMVAAWVPARSAARMSVLQALSGRRPLAAVPRRLPLFGSVAMVAGCGLVALGVMGNGGTSQSGDVWVLVSIGGTVAVFVGVLALSPWAIALVGRLTASASSSSRLAGRSLARSRTRSSAVVAAICVVAATLLGTASLLTSLSQDELFEYDTLPSLAGNLVAVGGRDGPARDEAVDLVQAVLPEASTATVHELAVATAGGETTHLETGFTRNTPNGGFEALYAGEGVAIATPEVLDLYEVPDDLRAVLVDGEAVSVVRAPDDVTDVELSMEEDGTVEPPRETIPLGGSFDSPSASYSLPSLLVSREVAEALGLSESPDARIVVANDETLNDAERRAVELVADDAAWAEQVDPTTPHVAVAVGTDDFFVTPTQVRSLVFGVAALLVAAVIAIGLALAAKDGEEETAVLRAVGASPRTLRRVGALRPALLMLTASLIALPAGLLPAWAVFAASEGDRSCIVVQDTTTIYGGGGCEPFGLGFRPDVPTLVLLLAAPLLVAAVTLSAGWLRDLARPARPSSFALAE
ncbi:MAG: FtsX-like permease family protein [Acidimicrobiales bacterium]|nr:FtsX-like permease family protein [Acidimicrobiales bacterium]